MYKNHEGYPDPAAGARSGKRTGHQKITIEPSA